MARLKSNQDLEDLIAGAVSWPVFRAVWGICACYAGMFVSFLIATWTDASGHLYFSDWNLLLPLFVAAPVIWGHAFVIGFLVQAALLIQWGFLIREEEEVPQGLWRIFLLAAILAAPPLEHFWRYLLWALAIGLIWWITHRLPAIALAALNRRGG